MKRFRQAAVSYARKRARTMATAVAKRVVRNVKKRVSRRMSKIQSKSITAFRKLGGQLKMGNSIRASDSTSGALSNTLHFYEVTKITQGESNTTRESNNILLKGFAYNFMFRNQMQKKMYLNYACITPKTFGSGVPDGTGWFRSNSTENNVAFGNSGLTSLSIYDRAMNSDAFLIHFRKKSILGGAYTNTGIDTVTSFDNNSNNCKHFKGYKSIKSRVSYSNNGSEDETANYKIYLVWWFTMLDETPPIQAGDGTMAVDYDVQVLFNGE